MNSKNDYQQLATSIFNGDTDIAIIVSKGEHYFITDNKENFVIDIRPFYDSYLEKGIINISEYNYALTNFRGGASKLDSDNLMLYLSSLDDGNVRSISWMREFFMNGFDHNDFSVFYDYVENYLMASNTEIEREEWQILESRLPKFYLNLDKKLFLHTDWDRTFEDDLPSDWKGMASSRFWALIPDNLQYWLINGMNFWKLQG